MKPWWHDAGALTPADLQHTFRMVRDTPAQRCPHIVTYRYRQQLRDAGRTTTHCPYCGETVRV